MKFWHRLLILITVIMLFLVISIGYFEYQATRETSEQIDAIGKDVLSEQTALFLSKIISDQADKAALKLDLVKKATIYASDVLSSAPEIERDDRKTAALLNSIMTTADSYFRQIFLARPDGSLVTASVLPGTQYVKSTLEPRLAGLITGDISDNWLEIPSLRPTNKLDVDAITAVAVDGINQEPSRMVALVSTSALIHEFNQDQPVTGSYTFLINENGVLLAAPPNARIELSPRPEYTPHGFISLIETADTAFKETLLRAALGQSDIEQLVIRNKKNFFTYRPIPGTRWRLCLVVPYSLATSSFNRLSAFIRYNSRAVRFKSIITTILLLLASMIVSAFLSRKLTRRLTELKNATQQIAEGDLEQEVVSKGKDEFGALARSFNLMTRTLKDSIRMLEASKEDLAKQLQTTTTLLETIPTPVYYKDAEGRYTGCNTAFEEFIGQSRSDIIGKAQDQSISSILGEDIHQKDLDLINTSKIQRDELRVQDSRGTIREMIYNKATIMGRESDPLGMIGVMTDITDLKQAERSLRQYERIVSATSDLMSFIDSGYKYLAVNDAYLTAHQKKADDIVGRYIPDLLGPSVFEKMVKGHVDKCLAGQKVNYQSWFDFTGMGRRYMDVTYYPYQETNAAITGVVVNSRDITRTTQLEAQLRQASKMESIGTLAGGIAHDFNNILSPIIGYVELLKDNIGGNSTADEYLSQIFKASLRARELVRQILIFSRQAEQEIKPIRIDTILKEVLKLARSTLPVTIEIRQNIVQTNNTIMADPTQIHQLAMNLITNAFHAMEMTGGVLTVGLEKKELGTDDLKDISMAPGVYLCLRVEDTGQGMDSQTLDKIFDPYFTTKLVDKGTGLGLAVAHGVVKSYGGAITVYSEIGKGTVFHVYFPVKESQLEKTIKPGKIELRGGNENILVVDDEIMVAEMLATILERLGYRVTTFSDSHEGLRFFTDNPQTIDLVISDLTMPNMTGVELINRIRKISKESKIILCTGFSEQMDNQKAKKLGVNAFIMKPVVRAELASIVRRVLDDDR